MDSLYLQDLFKFNYFTLELITTKWLAVNLVLLCFQVLSDPRFFANYALMVSLIEK